MASTTPDRSPGAAQTYPRIDLSVFAAMAAVPAPISVAQFCRWFACFATAGREQ